MKIGTLVACAAAATIAGSAAADFIGYYAPENWDFFAQDDGYLDLSGVPAEVTIYGTDTGTSYSYTTLTIEAQADSTISFDWAYDTFDGPPYDWCGYIVGGEYFFLTDQYAQSGSVEIEVSAGETFGFYVASLDGCCGAGYMTISNFVPAPGALALFGLAGLGFRRRR